MTNVQPWRTFRKQVKRCWNLRRGLPSKFDDFKAWLVTPVVGPHPDVSTAAWKNKGLQFGRDAIVPVARKIFQTEAGSPNIVVDDDSVDILAIDWPQNIHSLGLIQRQARSEIVKEGLRCDHIVVRTGCPIRFVGCFVRQLYVGEHARARLTLIDCYIENLSFDQGIGDNRLKTVEDLHIKGGTLLKIGAPVSFAGNPFGGRVTIEGLYLPRDMAEIDADADSSAREKVIYERRNIRAHLSAKEDTLAAGVFHSAELAMERVNEPFWNRVFSWIYEVGSDYGNSISRPIKWTIAAMIAMAAIVYGFDAVQVDTASAALGWKRQLQDALWLRAIYYPFYAIFNPLNLFDKTLLTAKTWPLSILLALLGVIGTTGLAFSLIALRRRFKLV
jgi:hypothetical protein